MFLSTYENKLDKKGRVSVPASYRSYLSNLGYNGVICYPSFNSQLMILSRIFIYFVWIMFLFFMFEEMPDKL